MGTFDICHTNQSTRSKLRSFPLFWSHAWKYNVQADERLTKVKEKQQTLRIVTIVMTCPPIASLWKFQYFRRPVCNPVEHLWWSFYCEKSKQLGIFTKKLHHRFSLGFSIRHCFYLKTLQTFYFFKAFYIKRLLKSVVSCKVLYFF